MSQSFVQRIIRYVAHHTLWATRIVQLAIFAIAPTLAFLLRFDFSVPPHYGRYMLPALSILVPAKLLGFHFFKLDRGWWQYVSILDFAHLAAANSWLFFLDYLLLFFLASRGFPRSVY